MAPKLQPPMYLDTATLNSTGTGIVELASTIPPCMNIFFPQVLLPATG